MDLLIPSGGFDDPLGLLSACHKRIAYFCDTLERLTTHLEFAGPDEAACHAAKRVMHYFQHAAPQHHADEELDLLPLLRLRTDSKRLSIIESWIKRIAKDHHDQDVLLKVLNQELQQITNGNSGRLNPPNDFIAMEREHYGFEDREVFPLARQLFRANDLEMLGRAMAYRRNCPYPEDT